MLRLTSIAFDSTGVSHDFNLEGQIIFTVTKWNRPEHPRYKGCVYTSQNVFWLSKEIHSSPEAALAVVTGGCRIG